MNLALSTSWNAFRHNNGREMFLEIEKMGFRAVELSFNLTPSMLSDIKQLDGNCRLKVLSVHNFCPIPVNKERKEALPDCYAMSSLKEDERRSSVKYAKISIDTACSLGAKAVVLHCGRVEIPDKTRDLLTLYRNGLKDSRLYKKIKESFIEERRTFSRKHLQKTLQSLDELNKYARLKGIYLGVETRFYYREIPSFEEFSAIFSKFPSSNIFYWHDTGHAQLMEDLGFCMHEEYLKNYSKYLLGIHLHNIIKGKDHLPIQKGEINFKKISRYLKNSTIKVIEAHYPASMSQIKQARFYLETLLKK